MKIVVIKTVLLNKIVGTKPKIGSIWTRMSTFKFNIFLSKRVVFKIVATYMGQPVCTYGNIYRTSQKKTAQKRMF